LGTCGEILQEEATDWAKTLRQALTWDTMKKAKATVREGRGE
jgi:hypothetical protein